MKARVPTLLLSTALGVFIFTTLSFFIVWIGFPAEKPSDSFKDALDFTGGIFAGATTFGAAIVAAYLFNDWREQKKYELEKEYIGKFSASFFDIYQSIYSQSSQIQFIYENYTRNKKYTFIKLDNIDFLKNTEDDKTAYYLSNLIGFLIPKSNFQLNYNEFQEYLLYLCIINDQVCNIYFKEILNSKSRSPFIAYQVDDEKLNKAQIDEYQKIIKIIGINTNLTINNQEKSLSYSDLLSEFNNSFEKLNSEIIKYLKP